MTDPFKTDVLDPLNKHLGQRIKVPAREGIEWSFAEDEEAREIRLTIASSELSGAFRSDGPSAPTLALCLAAALDGLPGAPARAAVNVVGPMPDTPKWGASPSRELLQYRRSAFVLAAYAELLPDRFHLTQDAAAAWAWPDQAWFAIERYRKNKGRPDKGKARLAFEIECRPDLHKAFCDGMEPIKRFQGLMPVQVFDGEVGKDTNWTQGGKVGVDLWVRSLDERRLHLFELGVGARSSIGNLAEAVCKACMLIYVAQKNGHFDREAEGLKAVRNARRAAIWFVADEFSPLVFDAEHGESTVLSWLNRALRGRNFQFGVLPFDGEESAPTFRFEDRWGGGMRARPSA